MEWLSPVIAANIASNLLLAFVFGFLYLTRRRDYLLYWCSAWGLNSVRYVFELSLTRNPESMILFLPVQLILIINSLFILKGTYRFLNRRIPAVWYAAAALTGGHLALGAIVPMRQATRLLPVFLFSGALIFWTGVVIIRFDEGKSVGKWMAAIALILWGLHRVNYPFLRPIAWFAPWGYHLSSGLTVTIALGMIILSFERTHRELGETRELLQEIIENTQEVFWVFDPHARRTLYLSPRFDAVFGRTGNRSSGSRRNSTGWSIPRIVRSADPSLSSPTMPGVRGGKPASGFSAPTERSAGSAGGSFRSAGPGTAGT